MRAATEIGWGVGDGILANLWHVRSVWPQRWSAAPLHYVSVTDSTNDDAWSLARAGGPEGSAVVAERQTSGRGRRGRRWFSPSGGLWMSVVLRPHLEASALPVLTMACALAAAGAVERCAGIRCGLKWPNDILLHGRKVGGILVESETGKAGLRAVVAGFGLNVNQPVSALPREISDTATSLFEHLGRPLRLSSLAGGLVRELEEYARCLAGQARGREAARLAERYAALDVLSGRIVRVQTGQRLVQGLCAGVDARGFLLVQDGDAVHAFASCDSVAVVEDAAR